MALSVIGNEEGIVHGTLKGYRQHRYRKVQPTEACGCLKALREDNASRAAAGMPRASREQQRWNNSGFTGEQGPSRPARSIQAAGDCVTEGCGSPDSGQRDLPWGWVSVRVSGSREPDRVYCSGSCATVGVALAELRMDPAAVAATG